MDEASSPLRRIALAAMLPIAALAVIPLVLALALAIYLRAFACAVWCLLGSLIRIRPRSAALPAPHFAERAVRTRIQDAKRSNP